MALQRILNHIFSFENRDPFRYYPSVIIPSVRLISIYFKTEKKVSLMCTKTQQAGAATALKNMGFLFAIKHGAQKVIDYTSGRRHPVNHNLESYIPVTYPNGLLWSPYPSILGTQEQEALNQEMERVPAASIGLVQFLPYAKFKDPPTHSPLALGLKTFAFFTEADTLFTKSTFWALFLPSHPLSAFHRGILSQPLMWRLGIYAAFSLFPSDLDNEELFQSRNDSIDVDLLHALRQTNLTGCTTLEACSYLIYSQTSRCQVFPFSKAGSLTWPVWATNFQTCAPIESLPILLREDRSSQLRILVKSGCPTFWEHQGR